MHDDIDERELIEAARNDRASFGELYERHFERVWAFVVRRVRDRAEAEDITSDVFHKALRNLGKFEWRGTPFIAWLYRIAANEIADRAKRSARQAANGDAPEAVVEADVERSMTLHRLVSDLPETQREVIIKRFVEQCSIAEIATQMGRSEGAIKQLQHRAMETLRERAGASNG